MAVTITNEAYAEFQRLKNAEKRRNEELMEAFRLKSVCNRCGFQARDIYPHQNRMCPTIHCEGSMVALDLKD